MNYDQDAFGTVYIAGVFLLTIPLKMQSLNICFCTNYII